MARTRRFKFVDECAECGAPMTFIAKERYVEMYCKACGYSTDPRITQHDWREDRRRKFQLLERGVQLQ